MGDFGGLAESILRSAHEGGLTKEAVEEIVSGYVNHEVNCYPGTPGAGCHPVAVFISLHGKLARSKRWPYNFEEILQALVQHAQGDCGGVTQQAVLITDSWWAPNFEKWRGNIEQIRRGGINLEIYLIGYPGSVIELRL